MAYIRSLRGQLIEKAPTGILIECAGVGYGVTVPLSTFDRLPGTNSEVALHIAHIIREDDQLLFGFATTKERELFMTLTAITGIGPKLALNILSALTPGELMMAIAEGDIKRLSSVSGVGKKTAERIIIELRDKIDPLEAMALKQPNGEAALSQNLRDAILSLVALGNKQEDARTLAQAAYEKNPNASVQELIRAALRK